MMRVISQILLAAGSSPAASILIKATLTTGLALLAVWFARRSRAAVRHSILVAAFGMLLAVPMASLFAPAIPLAVKAPAAKSPPRSIRTAQAISGSSRAVAPVPAAVAQRGMTLAGVLFAVWLAGAAIFLAPVAMGALALRRLCRSAVPWKRDGRIDILLHESLPGPMTCGILHPVIVMPRGAQSWSDEELDRAITHELEHVRRGDWAVQCLARAICAVYWFHPLVWTAWQNLVLEAERACDDAVVSSADAVAYADQLVGLAQRLSTVHRSPFLAMANRADLGMRVRALLDASQPRGRAGKRAVAFAAAAALAMVTAIGPLRIVAASQFAGDQLPGLSFHTSTVLVMVDAAVKDVNGQAIKGLKAGDFVLTEDEKPQRVAIFEQVALSASSDGLSDYYILGYYPLNRSLRDAYRKIAIALPDGPAGTSLDFRRGYFAEKPGFAAPTRPQVLESFGPRVPPVVKAPVLLSKTDPLYSEEARKAKLQGTVVLNVEIDATGRIDKAEVVKSLGLGLDQQAMEAVAQWKFAPATQYGTPLAVNASVGVDFVLR